jgi:hypothetical protein
MASIIPKQPPVRLGKGRVGKTPPEGRVQDVLRYAAASMFALFFLLVVIGLPILLLITSTYGLGDSICHRAEELLGGKNYEVHLDRVLFSPMRGFILDQLQVHDRSPARRLVVSADRLGASLNMDSLLRRAPQLERIFLHEATLDIPLGPADQPRLRLDHVRGVILCSPDQLRVASSSFELAGIRVDVTGTFLNPKKFAPRPVSTDGPGNTACTIDAIQQELHAISWERKVPVLTIQAGGDLGDDESLWVEQLRLEAGAGTWRNLSFRHLELLADYSHRNLRLEKLLLDDGTGIFQAAGCADFLQNRGHLEFAGAFSAAPIPELLLGVEKAKDWEWIDPLRVNGEGAVDWHAGKPLLDGTVRVESGRFRYRGVSMESLSGGAAFREGKTLIRDLEVHGDPGTLKADLMIAPGDKRLRLNASLFPERLAPLTGGHAAEALASMDSIDPLVVSFEGGLPGTDPLTIKGSGTLSLGKASMRGAWIDSLSARVEVGNGAADFRDILVRMGEGAGRGEFLYDYKNWEGRFPGVRSTLDPVKVMTWIDPRIAEGLMAYRFIKPPEVLLAGKVGLRNPEKNDLCIGVNAPMGMGYTLIGKDLPFGPTSGTVVLKGQKLLVDIPSSRLFGGDVAVKADISVEPGDKRFGASVHLDDVDFKDLTKLYFGYEESSGKLTADYAFRAVGGDDRAMTGKGHLRIKDGNVLAMPVLGPLSLLLGEVIPGFGYQSAREATADFSVDNGAVTTRDLLIKGKGFSMIGNGSIFYLEDRMSMNIRLNAQGLPGLVLFPVSKILEYESVGSAKNPKWRPKLLPKIGGSASPSPQPQTSPATP